MISMQNALNRPNYQETLAQINEQISYREEEVKKTEKPYLKAKKQESARRKTYKKDEENDRESRKPLVKKLDKTSSVFHEAEAKLEERQEKQEKMLAEDKDYYKERTAYIDARLVDRNEKLIQAREKYEKLLKKNQQSEDNAKKTEKALQEFQHIKEKVIGWNTQQETLLSKGPDEYNYEKRAILGEKNHQHIVETTTQQLVDYLDGKKGKRVPSSRGGPGAHEELPITELLPQEHVIEDEEFINRNDLKRLLKPGSISREYIDEHVAHEKNEIKEIFKITEPKPGALLKGEVIKIDQHGNAVLSFYGGDMDGLMYNRGNIGLKVGDKKTFMFKEKSKRKSRYIFELAKKKKSESQIRENAENAVV